MFETFGCTFGMKRGKHFLFGLLCQRFGYLRRIEYVNSEQKPAEYNKAIVY